MSTSTYYNTPEYQQFSSCWDIDGRASLKVSTDCSITLADGRWQIAPMSISFKCHRKFGCIDADIYDVFIRAVNGKAVDDMIANPNGCSHNETNGCGNLRGRLSECRCEILNRKTNPQIRHNYENHVISEIIKIIQKQNIACFKLNLAIFCSGGLLGEEILLFRLFDQLKRINASGVINLFLIDRYYDQSIKISSIYYKKIANKQSASLTDACGGQMELEQFLIEICKSVPPTINIEGTVFSESTQYIERAQSDGSFKHHLIIGADIEKSKDYMSEMSNKAGLGDAKPIVLLKTDKPLICQLEVSGELDKCYIPYQSQSVSQQPTLKHNQPQGVCIIV